MIQALRNLLVLRHTYPNTVDQQRARAVLVMSLLVIAIAVLFLGFVLLGALGIASTLTNPGTLVLITLATIGTLVLIYTLVQRGYLPTAALLFVVVLALATVPFTLEPSAIALTLALPLVAAGVLLDRRTFLAIVAALVLFLVARTMWHTQAYTQTSRIVYADTALGQGAGLIISVGVIALILFAFSGQTTDIARAVSRDLNEQRVISGFSRRANAAVLQGDESSVIREALRLIHFDLGYTIAQLYQLGGGGTFTRRLRLSLGSDNLIASSSATTSDQLVLQEVALSQQPVITHGDDRSSRAAHVIAPAQHAVSLPVFFQNELIAILDVQSSTAAPFTASQIANLTTLADQLGVALTSARELDELRRVRREQDALLQTRRTSVAEPESRGSALGEWARYLSRRAAETGAVDETPVFGFDMQATADQLLGASTLTRASDLPEPMREALLRGELVTHRTEHDLIVSAPILTRGVMLGALSFALPPDTALTARQRELIAAVTERLGVALENSRLFEQTQAQAQRERKANEVSQALLGTTDIDALLGIAADRFNDALGAVYTRVLVQPDTVIPPSMLPRPIPDSVAHSGGRTQPTTNGASPEQDA
jgi:GAF domain-containing protein